LFFNNNKELENRIKLLEATIAVMLDTQDALIKAFVTLDDEAKRLDLEQRYHLVDYLLHKSHKYHVIKDKDGKFQFDRLEISPEREANLMSMMVSISDKLDESKKS
jgi:vacuolar-type H+-ATPase subunit D/Vma8